MKLLLKVRSVPGVLLLAVLILSLIGVFGYAGGLPDSEGGTDHVSNGEELVRALADGSVANIYLSGGGIDLSEYDYVEINADRQSAKLMVNGNGGTISGMPKELAVAGTGSLETLQFASVGFQIQSGSTSSITIPDHHKGLQIKMDYIFSNNAGDLRLSNGGGTVHFSGYSYVKNIYTRASQIVIEDSLTYESSGSGAASQPVFFVTSKNGGVFIKEGAMATIDNPSAIFLDGSHDGYEFRTALNSMLYVKGASVTGSFVPGEIVIGEGSSVRLNVAGASGMAVMSAAERFEVQQNAAFSLQADSSPYPAVTTGRELFVDDNARFQVETRVDSEGRQQGPLVLIGADQYGNISSAAIKEQPEVSFQTPAYVLLKSGDSEITGGQASALGFLRPGTVHIRAEGVEYWQSAAQYAENEAPGYFQSGTYQTPATLSGQVTPVYDNGLTAAGEITSQASGDGSQLGSFTGMEVIAVKRFSDQPVPNYVNSGSQMIEGRGIPRSTILVKLNDGEFTATVDDYGGWYVIIDRRLQSWEPFWVRQTEPDKLPSEWVEGNVRGVA